jgi:hypothetical protein
LAAWKATRSWGVIAEMVALVPALGREARSSASKYVEMNSSAAR